MRSPKATTALLLGIVLFAGASCDEENYGEIATEAVREAMGKPFADYEAIGYPTNNYGLATSYDSEDPAEGFLCDMWYCIGVKDGNIPTDPRQRLEMNGFAAIGDSGAISLTETESKTFAVDLMLPKLYQVLKLGTKYNKDSIEAVTVTLGDGHVRYLRRQPMLAHITSLPADNPLRRAFDLGGLYMVTSDVVFESVSIDVKLDQSAGQELKAEVGTVPGGAGKFIDDARLSLKLTQRLDGRFEFSVDQPVIVLRYVRKQPGAAVWTSTDSWSEWDTVAVSAPMESSSPAPRW